MNEPPAPSFSEDAFPLQGVTGTVIAASFTVFKTFGCGFVEPVYRRAMMVELRHRGVWVEQEVKYEYSIAASPSGITRPTWLWTRVSSSRSKRVRCPTR